jgi:hypothetical protein
METDWESVYRNWKQGLGWKNRMRMFLQCEKWLGEMQECIWEGREWGRTANYIVPPEMQLPQPQPQPQAQAQQLPILAQQPVIILPQQHGNAPIPAPPVIQVENNEDMQDIVQIENGNGLENGNDLEQFSWPS